MIIMGTEQNFGRRKCRFLIWIFPLVIAIMIFSFSAQPGDDSAQLSDRFVQFFLHVRDQGGLFPHLSETEVVHLFSVLVRKSAHVTEYLLLCISLHVSFYVTGVKDQIRILSAFLITFGYACTDEVHQLFVPGRAGLFTDVLIDSSGAFVLCIILFIRMYLKQRTQ